MSDSAEQIVGVGMFIGMCAAFLFTIFALLSVWFEPSRKLATQAALVGLVIFTVLLVAAKVESGLYGPEPLGNGEIGVTIAFILLDALVWKAGRHVLRLRPQ